MSAQTSNIKYFIYARKSTEDEERQQLSIPAQISELRQFAKQESLNVVESFIESKTAKKPGRKIFNQLIERIKLGQANGILSWHPDRLARNAVDAGMIIHLLDMKKLADLKFPTFWFQSTPQGLFMLNISFGQAKFFCDNLSINTKRGLRAKVKAGHYPTLAPIGYLNDRLNKVIIVDKKKAFVIRKAFKLYSQGTYNLYQIADFMASQGLVSKKTKNAKGGKSFKSDRINYILSNPFYYGHFKYKDELHQGRHKPIISKKLFDQTQEIMAKKCWSYLKNKQQGKKRKYKPFLFSNLISCGECGYHITKETKHKYYKTLNKKQTFVYYRCTKASKVKKCSQLFIKKEKAIKDLFKICQKVSLNQALGKKVLERLSKDEQKQAQTNNLFSQNLKDEVEQIKTKTNKLLDLHLDSLIDRDEYLERKNKLTSKKKTLEDRLLNLAEYKNERIELAKDFITLAMQADKISKFNKIAGDKKTLKKSFINKVNEQRIGPPKNTDFSLKNSDFNPLEVQLASFYQKAELDLFLKDKNIYHINQKPWAALARRPTVRTMEA